MPSKDERAKLLRFLDAELTDEDVDRLAEVTAGLKSIQIKAILGPPENTDDIAERKRYVLEVLSGGKPATKEINERADKLVAITQSMTRDANSKLIAHDGKPPEPPPDARPDIDRLMC